MAKHTSKELEAVVTAQQQEIATISNAATASSLEVTRLKKVIEDLEHRNQLLTEERTKLRAGFYTLSCKMLEFHWCVPSIKKIVKNVTNHSIN